MSNDFVQLLLTLGINTQESSKNLKKQIENLEKNNLPNLNVVLGLDRDASVKNLKKHISSIQTNLPQLDVSLIVNSNTSDTKMFTQMEKRIESLQSKIKHLEGTLASVGKGSINGEQVFRGFDKSVLKAMNSIKGLESYLGSNGYAYKIDFDIKDGQKKAKQIVADVRNASGEVEKIKITPKFEKDGSVSFKQIEESIKNINFRDFHENQYKAYDLLSKIEKQGKITTKQISEYKQRISDANSNTELERELDLLKQLNNQRTSGLKIGSGSSNIRNQTREAIENIEQLKKTASNLGLDTSQYDKIINRMQTLSKIDIVNESQIVKADRIFGKLSSQMSALKNDTASFETVFKSFNNVLTSAERSGLMTANSIDAVRNSINFLNRTDLTLDVKVRRLKEEVSQLNAKLSNAKHTNKMMESMAKAKNEADKLAAALTKVENSYKRTVDKTAVTSVRQEIERLSDVPLFTNTNQVRAYNQELRGIETRIRQINSDATTGSRDSLGVINAFRIAMERFPISYQVGLKLFELLETP